MPPSSAVFLWFFVGCGRPARVPGPDAHPDGDTTEVEDSGACADTGTEEEAMYWEVWGLLNDAYPYFEYKGVDWAQLGNECRSVLACSGEVSYDRLVTEAMDCLLGPLSDGHTGIVDRDGDVHLYNWEFGSYNIDYGLVDTYLAPNSAAETQYTQTGTLDESRFGYIRVETWVTDALGDVDVRGLVDQVGPVEGMVIDMRLNGGGSPYTAQQLAGRFTDDIETPYAYLQSRVERDGDPGTHELGIKTAETMNLENVLGERFVGNTAVLIGPTCVSACETFVSMMLTLCEGVRTFGATTSGTDSRYQVELLGDGETQVYFSTTAVIAADRSTYIEWTGFDPDVPVEFEGDARDEVLEAALTWLRE